MAEYIEREALLADFGEEPMVWTDSEQEIQERYDWYKYKGIVESQPSVDVVKVVRCGECVHCMLWRRPKNKVIGDCRIRKMNCYDDQFFCMVGADDFCSYGEKRDNDATD